MRDYNNKFFLNSYVIIKANNLSTQTQFNTERIPEQNWRERLIEEESAFYTSFK